MLREEHLILVLFCFVTSALLVLLLRPNWKEALITYIRTFIKLLIGLMILLSNYSPKWEEGSLKTSTQFLPGYAHRVSYTIKLHIGIRGIAIILQEPTQPNKISNFNGALRDYNEIFDWSWSDANKMKENYEKAKARNLPKPILWTLEYFVVDERGSRYGRFYRSASWYTNLFLWAAFISYLISLVMFQTVINYGIYFLATSGVFMFISNTIWIMVKNPTPLQIILGDGIMITQYSTSFWYCFSTGIICILMSGILAMITVFYENYICTIFAMDPGKWYDEVIYLLKKERLSYYDFPLVNNDEDVDDSDEDSMGYTAVYLRRGTVSYHKHKYM